MSASGAEHLKQIAKEMADLVDQPGGPGGGAIILELLALIEQKDKEILLLQSGFPTTS